MENTNNPTQLERKDMDENKQGIDCQPFQLRP
jgi:hypothetical protein